MCMKCETVKILCQKFYWCNKQNLTTDSHPAHLFDTFMPIGKKRQYLPQVVSISQLITLTNTKPVLYNAVDGGKQYPYFDAFLVEDIMQHIRVYMQNVISPSLQVSYNFDSRHKNEINGPAIVNRVIGKNAHRSHREFKSFFSCCNPEIPSPPRKEQENWKCSAFFCHTIYVSQGAIYIGKYLICDK